MSQQSQRYGFYSRLKAEFPSQVIVDVTEVCNLACIHCPHPEFKKSEHYSGTFLDVSLNDKLINEVRELGSKVVGYIRYCSAGEPLVHPKIFEMMKKAKAESGTLVTLTTNGKLLRDKQQDLLLDTGIDFVDISLDAYSDEVYAKIRIGGDLKVTRANVLGLLQKIKARNSNMKVVVSFIEQPSNTHEIPLFEKFWKDNGANFVVIRRLHSAAGAISDVAEKMWAEGAKVRTPCVYPWERIVLGPTGRLAFCPADWTHGSSFIDYRTTTISETWQGEFYKKLRDAHLSNDYSCHKFCGQCPDWQATRWPDEGRGYADMVEDFKREGASIEPGSTL